MTTPSRLVPKFARGVRVARLPGNNVVLLVPEGVVKLAGSAPAIVELVDGSRSTGQIADVLAGRYHASRQTIEDDVVEILQGLAHRALVDFSEAPDQ